MLKGLWEILELRVTGAAPARCLNRWAAADLAFWRLRQESELDFTCRVFASELPALRREAARAQCELRVLRRFGLPLLLRRLRERPVLVAGTALVLALCLFAQGFVWFLRVEGNRRVSSEAVLRALEEEGVRFGTWGLSIDSEELKNRMLNRLPELSWLAVNRSGCVATVLCAEREPVEPPVERDGICNVVAARPGIIRELSVLDGFARKAPGDAVSEGEVLISGVMEWAVRVQATRARGEVYADTLRSAELICPAETVKKVYTGRTELCTSIIFQRKRRNLSGNSSIFGTMCDRITEIKEWRLPGGWPLPVRIETVTLLEYRLEPAALSPREAEALLNAEALRQTEEQMTAGTVEQGSAVIQKKNGGYLCRAALNCLELISRTVPAEPPREEECNGETDQRGTD